MNVLVDVVAVIYPTVGDEVAPAVVLSTQYMRVFGMPPERPPVVGQVVRQVPALRHTWSTVSVRHDFVVVPRSYFDPVIGNTSGEYVT